MTSATSKMTCGTRDEVIASAAALCDTWRREERRCQKWQTAKIGSSEMNRSCRPKQLPPAARRDCWLAAVATETSGDRVRRFTTDSKLSVEPLPPLFYFLPSCLYYLQVTNPNEWRKKIDHGKGGGKLKGILLSDNNKILLHVTWQVKFNGGCVTFLHSG